MTSVRLDQGPNGVHFSDPWLLTPLTVVATSVFAWDNNASQLSSDGTAFWTEIAARGLKDTTNWTSNTYKTLLSVSSGNGLVAWLGACTAGGAETTTFEFTVDGVLTTITITNASGERALLGRGSFIPTSFTTTNAELANSYGALQASATTFGSGASNGTTAIPWSMIDAFGTPCLRFNSSLLIRAKHSASITNSTATAYSGIMYRLGIGS